MWCHSRGSIKIRPPIRLPYLGVRNFERESLLPVQFVKIKGIITYFPESNSLFTKGIDLRLDHYCVGIFDCNGIFLALDDDRPMSYPLSK